MAEKDVIMKIMKYLAHISLNQIIDFLGIKTNGAQYLSEEIKDVRMAKCYQIKQVRSLILKYRFHKED